MLTKVLSNNDQIFESGEVEYLHCDETIFIDTKIFGLISLTVIASCNHGCSQNDYDYFGVRWGVGGFYLSAKITGNNATVLYVVQAIQVEK